MLQIPPLQFSYNGKVHLQAAFRFVLSPDGKDVYGLTLTNESNYIQFQQTLLQLINGLSVKPRNSCK